MFGIRLDPSQVKVEKPIFEVMPVNWGSVLAFLGLETQWRVVAGNKRLICLGLDYTALDVFMRRRGLSDHVFDDLQIMENAALVAFNEVYRRG